MLTLYYHFIPRTEEIIIKVEKNIIIFVDSKTIVLQHHLYVRRRHVTAVRGLARVR